MTNAEDKDKRDSASSGDKRSDSAESGMAVPRQSIHGLLVGKLLKLNNDGLPQVSYPGSLSSPVAARSIIQLSTSIVGKEVALQFENGDIDRPIVMGVLQHSASADALEEPDTRSSEDAVEESGDSSIVLQDTISSPDSELIIDGRKIELQAREQIVLRCGKSSITLTRAGKVIIRGAYISSKSSGANRIKGGSVQIN